MPPSVYSRSIFWNCWLLSPVAADAGLSLLLILVASVDGGLLGRKRVDGEDLSEIAKLKSQLSRLSANTMSSELILADIPIPSISISSMSTVVDVDAKACDAD